jgi:hypothetical protein
MEATGSIYMISIGDINYIGQALGTALSRWSSHIRLLRSNKHHCKALQESFNELGIAGVSFRILKEKIAHSELSNMENIFTIQFKGINAYAGRYAKIEMKKLIAQDIVDKIPYRTIAKKHNVSLGMISKVKSLYL